MKYTEAPNQATAYLREALPLMVRNNIPPNPLNYALWYTYVSKKVPALNAALDTTLNTYGTCPNLLSEQLYQNHLAENDTAGGNSEVLTGLLKLTSMLQDQAGTVAGDADTYSDQLRKSFAALQASREDPDSAMSLDSIIQELATNTEAINESTRRFQRKIDAAQKEIEQLRQELTKTRQDARMDVLTGLYNRRVFDTEINQLIDLDLPAGFSMILVDVDHFKHFNDTYGHLMGDKVLQYVGRILKEKCVEPLIPVRFGGEEFAVLMPGASLTDSEQLAEELRRRIEAIRIRQKSSGNVISSITASFGVATYASGDSTQTLIERADSALYRAKEQGRNQVVLQQTASIDRA
ncbi:GGDEF domain-containing protein [Marinobacterium lutimaris]|uniref:diguanylate cyclase n=1 Tax=Marinobacterium lutimaris TaxID=568106 RepID=A0A1H5UIX0_9GAMM|nr:GGDEF domain-containing protein [Marinobacterium lutimaris]SEF74984.1 diguanylate cyclase [Marinobacterium lutimaris]